MAYFTTLLISLLITLTLIPLLSRLAIRLEVVDHPNERKVHTEPVPRVGGAAMALAILMPFVIQRGFDTFATSVLLGASVIVVFGLIDDIYALDYRVKFLGQIGAALVVVIYGNVHVTTLGACLPEQCQVDFRVSLPFTIVTIVAATNAVNLADGLDGLAGGIMLLVFLCLSVLGYSNGDVFTTLLSIAVVGAIFGFLRFNTHPATVFMGDAGSQLLGFLGIVLALGLTQGEKALSPLMPLLLLGFPVLDTGVVIVERIKNNTSPFKADKNHFHHKLIRLGLFHSETVFVLYALQALFVGAAYVLRFHSEWVIILVFLFFVLSLICPVYVATAKGVQLQRRGVFDTLVKRELRRRFRKASIVLQCMQKTVESGLPLIVLLTVFLPADIPVWLSASSGVVMCGIVLTTVMGNGWEEKVIRIFLYGLLPLIMYQGTIQVAPWAGKVTLVSYAALYLVIVFASVLLVKLTRRTKGFQVTPTDFLIIAVALVLPNIPLPHLESMHLAFWSTCLIVLFFAFEVLIGELRYEVSKLGYMLLPALGVLTVRGGIL